MIRKYKREIISVVILASVAAVFSLSQIPDDFFISNDGCSYAKTAKNLVEGKGYTYMNEPNIVFPPGYPLVIALFYSITGDALSSGYYASSFAWILSIIPLFIIVRWLFKGKLLPTLITMSVIVTNPQLNILSRKILSEATYLLFLYISILLVILFIIKKNSKKPIHFILIGVSFGVTFLVRPEGFIFMLIVAVYAIFLYRKNLKRALPLIGLIVLFFLITVSPYTYYLYKHTGRITLSGRVGITLVGGEELGTGEHKLEYDRNLYAITPDGDGVYMYRGMFFSVPSYLIKNSKEIIQRFFYNLKEYILTLLGILLPFGIILLLFLFVRAENYDKKIAHFIPILIMPMIGNIFFFLIERYLYQYLIFILILMGIGLYKMGKLLKKKYNLKKIPVIGIQIIIIVLMHYPIFTYYLQPHEARDRPWNEQKELGLWIKENIDNTENKVVVARKAAVAFYADATYKALPWVENLHELYDYMDNVDADYLIVDTRYFYHLRPHLYYLVETSRNFARLEPVKIISNNKHTAILYKFLKNSSSG